MNRGFYLRRSIYVGFSRDQISLWPRFNLGWLVLDILPGPIADRIERVLREMGR